jgi:putative membrane protein
MRNILVATAVAVAMTAAPVFARAQKKNPKASGSKPDQSFVLEAANGGMAEVDLGRLATEKGTSDEVKKFGQRMVDDHGKANEELKSLAQSKSITLPAAVDAKDKALENRLSKLSGPAFDRAYMQAMLADHRKDVGAFRRESQAGKDPDVKSWASKTLPTLEDHLKMAEQTTKTAVATSGKRTTEKPAATKGSSTQPDLTKGKSPAPESSKNPPAPGR